MTVKMQTGCRFTAIRLGWHISGWCWQNENVVILTNILVIEFMKIVFDMSKNHSSIDCFLGFMFWCTETACYQHEWGFFAATDRAKKCLYNFVVSFFRNCHPIPLTLLWPLHLCTVDHVQDGLCWQWHCYWEEDAEWSVGHEGRPVHLW